MSYSNSDPVVYDEEHPWFQDERDDPSQANWLSEFLDPTGQTRKTVFLRGQTVLGILRGFVFVAAIGASAGSPWVGAGIGAIGLLILLVLSLVSHVRRLNDAGRSPLLALVIVFPLALALTTGVFSAAGASSKLEQMQAERAAAQTPAASVASAGDNASEPSAEATEDAKEKPPAQAPRRGPPRPLTIESVLSGIVSQVLNTWLLLSLATMCFSLFFVARRKSADLA